MRRVRRGSRPLGGHRGHVCSRLGGRGRHRALRCRGVAVRARRRVRAVPDLRQRTLALRIAPRSDRCRLPADVWRPHSGPEDAAVTASVAPLVRRRARSGRSSSASRVRQLEELDHRDPRRGVVGRHRLGHPDRRVRRSDDSRSSVSDAAYGGIANGVSGMWISIERRGVRSAGVTQEVIDARPFLLDR
jgi:hypothetical protein